MNAKNNDKQGKMTNQGKLGIVLYSLMPCVTDTFPPDVHIIVVNCPNHTIFIAIDGNTSHFTILNTQVTRKIK